ncbi:MAG: hypothetical protein RLZZ69_2636 [Cyanobacteriota bacterium]|jgi:DNA-binding transcriptional regulator YiaG
MVLSNEILNPLAIRQQLHLSQERMSHLLRVSCKTYLIEPWSGEAYRHLPMDKPLEFSPKL